MKILSGMIVNQPIVEVENLTKDFGHGRGVFDVSFKIEKGVCYGFLGPNGAGKTTTIRHIMGFTKPQQGETRVNGLVSWQSYFEILNGLGYLPGEIAMPEHLTGTQFIKMMADLRGVKDMSYTDELVKKFELEPSGILKRMSLGMKRKLAIVTAFMHDPAVLVLDEPTSGLDPVMQKIFIQFILDEKKRGKTILLSSHIFNEVDATCDIISIIKDGRLVSTFIADDLRHGKVKTFNIEFLTEDGFKSFTQTFEETCGTIFNIASVKENRNQVNVHINDDKINEFISLITDYKIKFFSELKFTLEDYFMSFYDKERSAETLPKGVIPNVVG
ncbi:MAG: ABC transporter ATP-binding protein [Firmicutes bacterium]|nr:ABC transporter ATP-binding protein [Bacillota bacterium]